VRLIWLDTSAPAISEDRSTAAVSRAEDAEIVLTHVAARAADFPRSLAEFRPAAAEAVQPQSSRSYQHPLRKLPHEYELEAHPRRSGV